MNAPGRLFVLAAPSGTGKSTLVGRLLESVEDLTFSVSWTTRSPRPGERDGREYRFTDRATFMRMAAEGAFLEWAEVHGELYGTARADVERALAAGRDVLLDIDVQGAAQLRERGEPARFVFLLPPDRATLERRLRGRHTEDEEQVARRLRNAAAEVRQFAAFDYVVINDDLERAAAELAAIVRADRARLDRRRALAERIVAGFPRPGEG